MNTSDLHIHNSSYTDVKKHLIHEIRPVPNSMFNIDNPISIELPARGHIGLIHLK